MYCIQELGLDPEKVNVNGGAIALGHPLDESRFLFLFATAEADRGVRWLRCTGARQIATGLNELQRRNGKVRFACDVVELLTNGLFR